MGRLEEMEVFIEITRSGGITSAARRLGVAPSAVSRRLKDLETRLNVQLINRTTRQISLTEAGRSFLAQAERILEDVEAAESDLSSAGGAVTGMIKLAAPLSWGISHLPPLVTGFCTANPGAQFDIDLSDRLVDMVGEGFDLALRIGNLADSSLMVRKLSKIRLRLVASPAFVDAHGPFDRIEDLSGAPALLYTGEHRPEMRRVATPAGEERHLPMTAVMRANNGDILAQAAADGIGVACQPTFIVADRLKDGSLLALFDEHDWGCIDLQVVWPQTRYLPARLRAFIDYLGRSFKDQ